jgi:cytochrome c1
VAGFHYSEAMKNSTIVWDNKSLDAFIMAPQKALPGTVMPFPGIQNQEERNDLIAYLEMLKYLGETPKYFARQHNCGSSSANLGGSVSGST